MSNKQNKQPEPFSMPIGNNLKSNIESYYPGYRTIKQFETVRKITSRKNFVFSTGPEQMFSPESPLNKYQGAVHFSYYDTEHKIHCFWILSDGSYKNERIL